MRQNIFKWIEDTFGDITPSFLVNYTENVTEKVDTDKDLCRIDEVSFIIKIEDAPKEWLMTTAHRKWKDEVYKAMALNNRDRFAFEAIHSVRNVTPSAADIMRGNNGKKLMNKHPLATPVNVFNKRIILSNKI